MGSGKSTIGEQLAPKLKRTALINEDKIKWFISDFRRSYRDNAIVSAVLLKMSQEYLKQSISLIIAQGISKTHRPIAPFAAMAKKYKARLLVYHLNAPREILLRRIGERQKFKHVRKPIAKTRILRNLRFWTRDRYAIGREFSTDEISAKKIVGEILKDIKKI